MRCEFCGGDTQTKLVKRQHWLHGKLYIVKNIEAEVCNECGEKYFHAKTLNAIDTLLTRQHVIEEKIVVEVISFNQIAA